MSSSSSSVSLSGSSSSPSKSCRIGIRSGALLSLILLASSFNSDIFASSLFEEEGLESGDLALQRVQTRRRTKRRTRIMPIPMIPPRRGPTLREGIRSGRLYSSGCKPDPFWPVVSVSTVLLPSLFEALIFKVRFSSRSLRAKKGSLEEKLATRTPSGSVATRWNVCSRPPSSPALQEMLGPEERL